MKVAVVVSGASVLGNIQMNGTSDTWLLNGWGNPEARLLLGKEKRMRRFSVLVTPLRLSLDDSSAKSCEIFLEAKERDCSLSPCRLMR